MKISAGDPTIYRFGVFELDTSAHELRRQGVRIRLQDQPYQVLRLLLEQAGHVVTREQLRSRIWPSSVIVDFDHGLNSAMGRLREALGDTAATPRYIETIPRIGYRFLDTVATSAASAASTGANDATPTLTVEPALPATTAPDVRKRWFAVTAGAAVVAILALLMRPGPDERDARTSPPPAANAAEAPGPLLAVLPFVNLTPDEQDDYLSDGLTDDLVAKLAGVRGLKVIARTSAFRFKGKQEPPAAIGQALSASHVLEGTVRHTGSHLQVVTRLTDARAAKLVWEQDFNRELTDIDQMQEDIALAVAAALDVAVPDRVAARIRRQGTTDPEALRLYLIAQSHLLGRARAVDMDVAKRSLDAAVARDPNFAAAYAALARYHLRRVAGAMADPEQNSRLGTEAAERAVALDPSSSEALQARANFQFLRYRFRGDYAAYIAGQTDMQRAIELDPSNSVAFEDFGRATLWHEPELAQGLLEHAIKLDMLCVGPNTMIASLLGNGGQLDAARKRCADVLERYPDGGGCVMAIATLETYFGYFDRAMPLLRKSEKGLGGPARIQLWSVHMSMNDAAGALQWLDFGRNEMEKALSRAARFAMEHRYADAFAVLDRHRGDFAASRLLDLPAARFALIAGRPREALAILNARMPDLAAGIEPISPRNLMPAIDLATALAQTGAPDEARALLERIAAYLDSPSVLRLPLFAYQRARVHALAGEKDAAWRALDRAYDAGLRVTWALDLRPQSLFYIDPIEADPSLQLLRGDPRLQNWFARIRTDNSRTLERLNSSQLAATDG